MSVALELSCQTDLASAPQIVDCEMERLRKSASVEQDIPAYDLHDRASRLNGLRQVVPQMAAIIAKMPSCRERFRLAVKLRSIQRNLLPNDAALRAHCDQLLVTMRDLVRCAFINYGASYAKHMPATVDLLASAKDAGLDFASSNYSQNQQQ